MERLISYGYCPMSITIAQKNLITGIKAKSPIDTIGGCRLPFRFGHKISFKGETWLEDDGSSHVFVDLITVPYLEFLYKTKKIKKAVSIWAKLHADEDCRVIIYGLHTPYLKCARVLKKYIKTLTITCIVPDLPEYYDFHPSRLKKFFKSIDLKNIDREMKNCDRFVLFAETMSNRLNLNKNQYIVMEGCVNCDHYIGKDNSEKNNSNIVYLYSGILNYGYGIDKLLSAFKLINNQNIELWLAGSGAMEHDINVASEADTRIKYLGYISDRELLRKYQREADYLLCMIPPDNIATEYCFPSKLLEYMISGNPTVSFKLRGVGDEYYKYLITFSDDSPKGVADTISRLSCLSKDERDEIGEKAKEFIVNNKNHYIQGGKVFDYATK